MTGYLAAEARSNRGRMTDNPEGAGTVMNTPDLIDSKACNRAEENMTDDKSKKGIGDLSAGTWCRNLLSELSDAWILTLQDQMPAYRLSYLCVPPPWHTSGATVECRLEYVLETFPAETAMSEEFNCSPTCAWLRPRRRRAMMRDAHPTLTHSAKQCSRNSAAPSRPNRLSVRSRSIRQPGTGSPHAKLA